MSDAPALVTLTKPNKPLLEGTISLPGSKSETNRCLLLSALLPSGLQLHNCSDSEDATVFLNWLQGLGYEVSRDGNTVQVDGDSAAIQPARRTFDLGLAGTALRFITAASCFLPGTHVLRGAARLQQRPVAPLVEALRRAGAHIEYMDKEGFLPLQIEGDAALSPTAFEVDARQSSQLLSALMLLAPVLPLGCSIQVNGLTSHSYMELTQGLLKSWGMRWEWATESRLELVAKTSPPAAYTIESDWSAASYPLGLAATYPAKLCLQHLGADSLQGDHRQLDIFRQWGMQLCFDDEKLYVDSTRCVVRTLDYDFTQMPDLAQTFAVLACWADAPSMLKGLHTLPLKETDRIAGLVAELHKLGVATHATTDSLQVMAPAHLAQQSAVATYADHRFAMAFSLLVNRLGTLRIADPNVVAKSYPNYWQDMRHLGYGVALT